jgi:hypothetical protein
MSESAAGYLAHQAAIVGGVPVPTNLGGLIRFFEEFVPRYLTKKNGEPVGRRAAQKIARQHHLPLVRLGNAVFIDVELAADRLREAQLMPDREPRRRGRPRKSPG